MNSLKLKFAGISVKVSAAFALKGGGHFYNMRLHAHLSEDAIKAEATASPSF